MKADFDDFGKLVLTPESNAERIALKFWEEGNTIPMHDIVRAEKHYIRGSAIKLEPFKPKQ